MNLQQIFHKSRAIVEDYTQEMDMISSIDDRRESSYFPGAPLEEAPDMEQLYAEVGFDSLEEVMALENENCSEELGVGGCEAEVVSVENGSQSGGCAVEEEFSDLTTKLQKFSYFFDCGGKRAKLVFETFQVDKEATELEEMKSVYWDREVMKQASGVDFEGLGIVRPIIQMRANYVKDNALDGTTNSIRWKVYYVKDCEAKASANDFAGFVGMAIGEAKELSVYSYFNRRCIAKRIGPKAMLCLLHIYMDNEAWFQQRVDALVILADPLNRACVKLIEKFLVNNAEQVKNPAEVDGTWPFGPILSCPVQIRKNKYCCNLQYMKRIWNVHMQQAVNTADLLLCDNLKFNTEPEKVKLLDIPLHSPSSKRKNSVDFCDLDAKLQKFTYTFNWGDERGKLIFETLDVNKENSELQEMKSVFLDRKVTNQIDGVEVDYLEQIGKMRADYMETNALGGNRKCIRWKVYHIKDVGAATAEKTFVGYIGMKITERKELSIHSYFRLQCTGKKVGTKAMLCLLHVYLDNEAWFRQKVDMLLIWIQPANHACIALKEKLLMDNSHQIKNPASSNETWPYTHPYAKLMTLHLNKYACSLYVVKGIWKAHMQQKLNTADLLLYDSLEFTTAPKRLRLLDQPKQSPRIKRKTNEDPEELCYLDTKLQEFTYTFDRGDARAKLTFKTFQVDKESSELEELKCVFGDKQVMKQADGRDIGVERPIEKMRDVFLETNALGGKSQSIRWKLYYEENANAEASEPEFIGFVGLSIKEHRRMMVSMHFKVQGQSRFIGTKAMICMLHIYLDHESWFVKRIESLTFWVQPKNLACLTLKDRFLLGASARVRNPSSPHGTWELCPFRHKAAKPVMITINKYICSLGSLKEIWKVHMRQEVNTADLLLYDSLKLAPEQKKAKPHDDVGPVEPTGFFKVMEDFMKIVKWDKAMERSLQEFSFKIDREELTFITFECVGSTKELENVHSLFSETGDGNSIESPIETVEEANVLRRQMRSETSFMSKLQAMRWKLFVSGNFIGCVGLRKQGSHLVPTIHLLSQYRSKGFGRRVLLCLLIKFLSNKEWFRRNFDGLTIWVHPGDIKALGLLYKIIENPVQVQNPEQGMGLWILETKEASGSVSKQLALKFELDGFSRVESLLLSSLTVIHPNKEWKIRSESKKVTLMKSPPRLGLRHVVIGDCQLDDLVATLSTRTKTEDCHTTLKAGGSLYVHLPCLGGDPEVFYLLFFEAESVVRTFELVLSRRCSEQRQFVALDAASVEEYRKVKIRMVDEKLNGFQAHFVKIDVRMFDSATNNVCHGLRGAWRSMKLRYKKRYYKTKFQDPLQELHLRQVELDHEII